MNTNSEKDAQLWEVAKKRAGFKRHLGVYLVINIFLWAIWFVTGKENDSNAIPWPLWTTIGWGIGLTFHYLGAYVHTGNNSIEREYQKLKQNQ